MTAYIYSSRGELLQVDLPDGRTVTFDHDPMGRRIAKRINGAIVEKYLWQGLITLLAVYDGSDNLIQRFEYADGRMPVAMDQGGSVYYLGYDQVGSLRVVTDASGNVVKRVDYDSFGNILADTNTSMQVPFGFAGGLHDRDIGLVRFGLRDYDPIIGRWTAKDPIGFAGGDPDLYGYVQNDPVNAVDPLGLASYYVNWDMISFTAPGMGGTKISGFVVSTIPNKDGATYDAVRFEGHFIGTAYSPWWLPLNGTVNNEEFFEDGYACDDVDLNRIEGYSAYLAGSMALGKFGYSGGGWIFGGLEGTKKTPSKAEGLDLGVEFMTGRINTVGSVYKVHGDTLWGNVK